MINVDTAGHVVEKIITMAVVMTGSSFFVFILITMMTRTKLELKLKIIMTITASNTGSSLFVFYILVAAFLLDQKHKLSGVAQRPLPSISRVISIERF